MAINDSRSMNQDLRMGARDGAFKCLTPDRGGEVDPTHATYRMNVTKSQFPTGELYSFTERHPLADSSDGVFHS
jgi:hypothetical protein